MFQKEVAERIVAAPGSKAYGRLSVLAQWRCDARIVFEIPPRAFTPPPKVTSAVVHLDALPAPRFPADARSSPRSSPSPSASAARCSAPASAPSAPTSRRCSPRPASRRPSAPSRYPSKPSAASPASSRRGVPTRAAPETARPAGRPGVSDLRTAHAPDCLGRAVRRSARARRRSGAPAFRPVTKSGCGRPPGRTCVRSAGAATSGFRRPAEIRSPTVPRTPRSGDWTRPCLGMPRRVGRELALGSGTPGRSWAAAARSLPVLCMPNSRLTEFTIYSDYRWLTPCARVRKRGIPRLSEAGLIPEPAQRLAAGEGLEVAARAVEEGADAVGIVDRQAAQPPADGLLDEPVAVGGVAGGPAEDALAGRRLGGVGMALLRPRQGGDEGGAPDPGVRVGGPALDDVEALGSAASRRSIALQAWSAIAQASKSGTQDRTSLQTSASWSRIRACVSSFAAAMRASWMSLRQSARASATRPGTSRSARQPATRASMPGLATPSVRRPVL